MCPTFRSLLTACGRTFFPRHRTLSAHCSTKVISHDRRVPHTGSSCCFHSNWSMTEVTYDVTCADKVMKVAIALNNSHSTVFLDKLKGFESCQPSVEDGKAIIELSLEHFHDCGTSRMTNKYTGKTIFYNRVIIEQPDRPRELLLVKCVLPGDKSKSYSSELRHRRDVLPEGFFEADVFNITSVVGYAPEPFLNLAIRQNGRVLDTTYNVQPGTPLEMLIYLDEKSASTYGLLTSYLKVTDDRPDHDEIIVMNGCSIDPYIFGNFETTDGGKTLYSKFRAFKFPDSNYVLFVGTVNVCLKQCRGVPCGNGQLGFGRKKREIPAEMPFDPNKLYEVEMTTILKVQFAPDHFKPKKGSIESTYEGLPSNQVAALIQENCATSLCARLILLTMALLLHMLRH